MLSVIVVGCAKRPDAIVPTSIPMNAYTGLSCPDLTIALLQEESALNGLSSQQNSAATGDALGVFLVGLPLASATGGDKEGMIAVTKGKVEAMKAAKLSKGCS